LENVPDEIKREVMRHLIANLATAQYSLRVQARVYNGIEPGGQTVKNLAAQMTQNEQALDGYRAELATLGVME
jgi:hypothetical protein